MAQSILVHYQFISQKTDKLMHHYTQALLKSILKRDIHRYYETEVTNIRKDNGFYQVMTTTGTLYAQK